MGKDQCTLSHFVCILGHHRTMVTADVLRYVRASYRHHGTLGYVRHSKLGEAATLFVPKSWWNLSNYYHVD